MFSGVRLRGYKDIDSGYSLENLHPRHPHVEDMSWPNASKNWEQNNHWFPFGLSTFLWNFLYVNSLLWIWSVGTPPNCLVSLAKIQPYHPNQEHSFFLWLCQIELTDMTDSFISWMRGGLWSLDLFTHLKPHQKAISRRWGIRHPVFMWANPGQVEGAKRETDGCTDVASDTSRNSVFLPTLHWNVSKIYHLFLWIVYIWRINTFFT